MIMMPTGIHIPRIKAKFTLSLSTGVVFPLSVDPPFIDTLLDYTGIPAKLLLTLNKLFNAVI